MATWIVHLRIAENLLEKIPNLLPDKFALGNVAPDSGKPDEKWENFTPPTYITHFSDPKDELRLCKDLAFYRDWILTQPINSDPIISSFRLGYFFHLVLDNLWFQKIGMPTHQRFALQFDEDKDFIWEVKKDWYGLDFIYIRDHPDCLYWKVFVHAMPETGKLDFLLPERIQWSVKHIQSYYQRDDKEVHELYRRPYIYLSQAEMDQFVDESCSELLRIYQYLQENSVDAGKADSALNIQI
jgi:hypothetical protein